MFRATSCSSSGESTVPIQHLVYVTLCKWPSDMQVGKFLPDRHPRRSPTQSDIYQMLYWYNWFSWWWARGCSKHVEDWNKYIRKKNCASSWSFNTLNSELNPMCHLLVLLGAHHIFHVSGLRVNRISPLEYNDGSIQTNPQLPPTPPTLNCDWFKRGFYAKQICTFYVTSYWVSFDLARLACELPELQ
jgi:hypothetical protein